MIGALIFGFFAGLFGRWLAPGKHKMGLLWTLLVGIAGSLVGFWLFTSILGIGDTDKFNLGGLPGAAIGAALVIWVADKISK